MFKKKLAFLLCVMLVFSIAGYFVCAAAGTKKNLPPEREVRVVTSFYPVYNMVQNLLSRTEQAEVVNLTKNQSGCLHEYQLTTEDMRVLAGADAFIMNGAGMELFLEAVAEEYKELPIVITTTGLALLEGSGHAHHHETETDEENEAHEHEVNGHCWMDVERYREQLRYTKEELEGLFPQYGATVSRAYQEYDAQLQKLAEEKEELEAILSGTHVVIFHDAFAYLADMLSMEVIGSVALDEDTVPSAGEIAEIIEEIRYHKEAWILIEEVYASHAEKIVAETGAKVVYLNPLVTGDGSKDSYVNGMKENFEALKDSYGGIHKETTE